MWEDVPTSTDQPPGHCSEPCGNLLHSLTIFIVDQDALTDGDTKFIQPITRKHPRLYCAMTTHSENFGPQIIPQQTPLPKFHVLTRMIWTAAMAPQNAGSILQTKNVRPQYHTLVHNVCETPVNTSRDLWTTDNGVTGHYRNFLFSHA